MFDFSMSPSWFPEELEVRLQNIGIEEVADYTPRTEQLPGDIYVAKMSLNLIQVWILLQIEYDYTDPTVDTTFVDALEEFWYFQMEDIVDRQLRPDHSLEVRESFVLVQAPIFIESPNADYEIDAIKPLVMSFRLGPDFRHS